MDPPTERRKSKSSTKFKGITRGITRSFTFKSEKKQGDSESIAKSASESISHSPPESITKSAPESIARSIAESRPKSASESIATRSARDVPPLLEADETAPPHAGLETAPSHPGLETASSHTELCTPLYTADLNIQVSLHFDEPLDFSYSRHYAGSSSLVVTEKLCQGLLRRVDHCSEELITRKDSSALERTKDDGTGKPARFELDVRINRGAELWATRSFKSYQKTPLTADEAREIALETHHIVGFFLRRHDDGFAWRDGPMRDDISLSPETHPFRGPGRVQPMSCIPRSYFLEKSQSFEWTPGYTIHLSMTNRHHRRVPVEWKNMVEVNSQQTTPLNLETAERLFFEASFSLERVIRSERESFEERHRSCTYSDGCPHCRQQDGNGTELELEIKNNLGPQFEHLRRTISIKTPLFSHPRGQDCESFTKGLEQAFIRIRNDADGKVSRLNDLEFRIIELRGRGWALQEPLLFTIGPASTHSRRSIEAILDRMQTSVTDILRRNAITVRMTAHKRGHFIIDKTLVAREPLDKADDKKKNSQNAKEETLDRLRTRIEKDIEMICLDTLSLGDSEEGDVVPNGLAPKCLPAGEDETSGTDLLSTEQKTAAEWVEDQGYVKTPTAEIGIQTMLTAEIGIQITPDELPEPPLLGNTTPSPFSGDGPTPWGTRLRTPQVHEKVPGVEAGYFEGPINNNAVYYHGQEEVSAYRFNDPIGKSPLPSTTQQTKPTITQSPFVRGHVASEDTKTPERLSSRSSSPQYRRRRTDTLSSFEAGQVLLPCGSINQISKGNSSSEASEPKVATADPVNTVSDYDVALRALETNGFSQSRSDYEFSAPPTITTLGDTPPKARVPFSPIVSRLRNLSPDPSERELPLSPLPDRPSSSRRPRGSSLSSAGYVGFQEEKIVEVGLRRVLMGSATREPRSISRAGPRVGRPSSERGISPLKEEIQRPRRWHSHYCSCIRVHQHHHHPPSPPEAFGLAAHTRDHSLLEHHQMGHLTKKASRGDDDDHRDDKRRPQKKGSSSSGNGNSRCPIKKLRKKGKGKVAEEDPDLGWEQDYQIAPQQAQQEWAQAHQQQQRQLQQEPPDSISGMYWEEGDPAQYAQSTSSETGSLIRLRDRAGEAARSNRLTQRVVLGGHVYRDVQIDQEGRRVARDHAGASWHLDVNNNRIGTWWEGAWHHLGAYGNPDRPYVATRADLSTVSEGTENGNC
ncbi:hypothetical protein DL764_007168 [Monosporascus ibericus]|uniref:Uncharacterized protein n=1 Tax=Monosporascus ibericus TaxID=155417 RepID=A0A4Q4T600_9PEZI|nr:hypothetical protein DL764_007168 [Monosporascus ibericus]